MNGINNFFLKNMSSLVHTFLKPGITSCLSRIVVLSFLILFFSSYCYSQEKENRERSLNLSGTASLSTNGFDVVPAFNLGKPDLSVYFSAGRRFTFEPQFRFSIKGKPWKIRFVMRYKLVQSENFYLDLLATPLINFVEPTVIRNGVETKIIQGLRTSTFESNAVINIRDNLGLGIHLLYSILLENSFPDLTQYSQSIGINFNVKKIKLSNKINLSVKPEIYYLGLDRSSGFYLSSIFKFEKQGSPLSIFSTVNEAIHSTVSATKFQGNFGISYLMF